MRCLNSKTKTKKKKTLKLELLINEEFRCRNLKIKSHRCEIVNKLSINK